MDRLPNNIERALISASVLSTMAYLDSDGMSGLTEEEIGDISWTAYTSQVHIEGIRARWYLKMSAKVNLAIAALIKMNKRWRHNPCRHNIRHNIRKAIEVRWEDRCEIEALLASDGIDFDIFDDIGQEDSVRYDRRHNGAPMFGYRYSLADIERIDRWHDEQFRHGSWGGIPTPIQMQLCEDDACEMECMH